MYVLDGEHRGTQQVLSLLDQFEYKWAPQGYWIVDGREHPLENTVGPLVYDHLPPTWVFAMVIKLECGNSIPPHCDKPLAAGVTRRHLVLDTNDSSWCMHNNRWQQMELGGVYTMEPQFVHAAINWGVTPRIHLVVDSKED